ncbi:ATP synthase regulation protein NCA2-domain-containing protein [Hyaloraphidium curvatum]|nr:ATP synthase regulation protein NCA2-domain-containing protein [Hyaloraphidium curvatum]
MSRRTDSLTAALTRLDAELLLPAAQEQSAAAHALVAAVDSPLFSPAAHSDPDAAVPSPRQLIRLLDSVENEKGGSALRKVFDAKVALISREVLSQALISAVLPVNRDVLYYSQLENDRLWRGVYFVQTLPARLVSYARSFWGTSAPLSLEGLKASGGLFVEAMLPASKLTRRAGAPAWPALGSAARLLRSEVRVKKAQLESAIGLLAGCIGYLGKADEEAADAGAVAAAVTAQCAKVLDVVRTATEEPLDVGVADTTMEDLAASLGSGAPAASSSSPKDLRSLLEELESLPSRLGTALAPVSRPSAVARYWLPAAAGVFALASLRSRAAANWDDLVQFASDARDAARDFFNRWIVEPLSSLWATVRPSADSIDMMSNAENSLRADLESLERMVADFAKDTGSVPDEAAAKEVAELARRGDLSVVQRKYEQELKRPISAALRGDLVRTLLIQIQKSKVDAETALASIDKLIQQQQLNFVILGAIPSFLVLYFLLSWLRALRNEQAFLGREESFALLRASVREAEVLLNRWEGSLQDEGMLRIQARIMLSRRNLVEGPLRGEFVEDVLELEDAGLDAAQKRAVLERMRWTYKPLWSVAR